jgi:putative aldouronate transport system substrate-binding protein
VRRFGFLFALAALALVAAGAWANGGKESGTTGGTTADASKLAPYNLVWYMRGRGAEKDEGLVEDALNKYLKGRINATIKIINIDRGAFPDRMTAIIASGESFDMGFTASWVVNYAQYAQKGAFVWLNDPANNLQEKYLKGTVAALGDFFYGGSAIDGKHYAVPVNKEWAHSNGFVLRKDILDKDGIKVTKRDMTLAEMEPIFQAVHDKEPGMIAVQAYANNSPITSYIDWDFPAGSRVPIVDYNTGADKKIYNMFERPETIAYYNLIRSWYLKGFIRKDAASTEDYTPDLASGKLFSSSVVTHPGQPGESEQGFGFPFIVVNNTVPTMSTAETQGAMNFISVTSKDKDRAAMFMELENTDPFVNNTVAFGVEGTHWVKTPSGQIDFPKGVDAKISGYVPAINWAFGNQFLNYLWTTEDPNKWKNYIAYNKSAVPANSLGFIPDYEPIKNEIAALSNVWAEFEPGLEVGSSDPAVYVPQANAKAKAAGIDRAIAELQKQYDAWRAKNGK